MNCGMTEVKPYQRSVLFVHGMGRSPMSAWPMLSQLRHAGMNTHTFGYFVSLESFAKIKARIVLRVTELSREGRYILVGHSLGGVLIRSALAELPVETPGPEHIFLIGSPVKAARLATRLGKNPLFRLATGDCGQILASESLMAMVPPAQFPVTSIVGVRGIQGRLSPFGDEPNDGVVALSEVSSGWLSSQFRLPLFHGILPASHQVARIIIERLKSAEAEKPLAPFGCCREY
jgi:hypothetical protein